MLKYALFFFILAVIAGLLGFTEIAGAAATLAKIFFFIFAVIWIVLLALGVFVFKSLS